MPPVCPPVGPARPRPHPSPPRLGRATRLAALVLALVTAPALLTACIAPPELLSTGALPILVVCGFHNTAVPTSCRDEVAPLVTRFNQNGSYAYFVNLTGPNDNESSIEQIRAAVDTVLAMPRFHDANPPVTQVNLLGYSMGGLGARAFISRAYQTNRRAPDGVLYTDKVRRYVALGTGQQPDPSMCTMVTLTLIYYPRSDNLPAYRQMCTGSSFLQSINGTPNSGGVLPPGMDDTPLGLMPWTNCTSECRDDELGHIEYYVLWVTGDIGTASNGPNAPLVDGGACEDYISSPRLDHLAAPGNSTVQSHIADAFNGICRGVPRYRPW